MKKFNEFDMVLVRYKGVEYPMCIISYDKDSKTLELESLRHDNFRLTVGYDDVKKISNFGF